MALLAMAAFDPRTALTEGYTAVGTVAYNTSTKRTGTAAIETSRPTNTGAVQFSFNSGNVLDRTYYIRVYMYIATLGSGGIANVLSIGSGGTTVTTCQVSSTGAITLTAWNGASMANVTGSPTAAGTVAAGQWYRVEVSINVTSSGNDTVELRIDGVQKVFSSALTIGNTSAWAPNRVTFGNPGTNSIVYWDDFQINDSTGASNNTFPGAGQILCLLPTADVSIGTWTGGAGGTTNLFQAIDNQPPVGVADGSDTNASQINSTGSGTATFSFPSYASQGIGTANTILGVRAISAMGRGATLANVGAEITSNPTGPAISQGAVSQVGTYPTNWSSRPGSIIESPSVDRYAAIQASVSASAATGQCCALAVQVAVAGTLTSAGTRHTKSLSDSVTLSDSASPVLTLGGGSTLPKAEGWTWDWGLDF